MSTAAKGGFPGCPRRKIEKRKINNLNHKNHVQKWDNHLSITEQIKKNLRKFYEMFGGSDEDEEFHGFSSEECGLRAYKRISGSARGNSRIPDILGSPIDLTKKKVTTRLAHARNSLEALPSSERTRRKKRTIVRRRYSKSEVPIVEGNNVPTEPLVRVSSSESDYNVSADQGFLKYKNSNLDFHCLSESVGFAVSSSTTLKHPVTKSNKTSPIKPATFIAPSLSQHMHQVTNVTPTCLKIKLNQDEENGPGHPKVLAKALLARANKRGRKQAKQSSVELDEPVHTSTPISSSSKSKTKSFVLPTKSSRSSRIIKANRRYVDSDDAANNIEVKDTSTEHLPSVHGVQHHEGSYSEASKVRTDASYVSPNKGRPLLKEATFRVAALANINNKPQPTRNLNKGISTRIRARKLIKRARFKHPTSSSTLVVGNDFDDENRSKRNLIREATFKPPNYSNRQSSSSESEKDKISDLGFSKDEWKKILAYEMKSVTEKAWTKQEIHNVLHGANTFFNSWSSIARHYNFQTEHRDWSSIKTKIKTLTNVGLLSDSLKVKSSILLQLKPCYSDNPSVTVFTPRELRMRGMKHNVECDVGEGGRLVGYSGIADDEDRCNFGGVISKKKRSPNTCRKRFEQWEKLLSEDSADEESSYLGLTPSSFKLMCHTKRETKYSPWTTRELHNLIHGIYIFGLGEWSQICSMYRFNPQRNNLQLRCRYKSLACRGLVVAGKVKKEILPLLRPKYSAQGRKFLGITQKTQKTTSGSEFEKSDDKTKSSVDKGNDIEKRKTRSRKRSKSTDTDLTSPPRKQAYHLFGTAPVWDDSNAGLQSLSSNSDVEEEPAPGEIRSPTEEMGKKGERGRKTSSESTSSRKKKEVHVTPTSNAKSGGPRIKHVCRRASLVTGQKPATYNDDSVNPQLSALPREEREKIAAEQEKVRDTQKKRKSVSSDSETEANYSPVRPSARRRDKTVKIVSVQNNQDGKFGRRKTNNRKRCNSCKNCKVRKCGVCENCRNSTNDNLCLRKPPCLNPSDGFGLAVKELRKKYNNSNVTTRRSTPPPDVEKSSKFETASQKTSQRSAASGIILSPDSRHRIQQELHERDQQQIASVVKIDEWKERYELEDLWNTGGVSIITSRTPSTKIVCFLCGSVGKSRPARRISSTSDSSICSSDLIAPTPLFIFCVSCCEPFHSFCLDDHEQQGAINDAKKGIWICKRCKSCNVCGRPDDLLECKRCNKTYHSQCLGPSYPTRPSKNQVWVCMRCVRCRSCGASRPGRRPGSKWTHDFQLCQRCGDLFDKGNFCPICRRCYRDEDYETRMIQCGTCKRWVHSRCESLTIEMYTLLSHLPDDVQYICPDCDGRRSKVELELSHSDNTLTDDSVNDSLEGDKMRGLLCKLPPPSWKKRIESEVQSGIENVMMALFHNKDAACILKKSVVHDSEDDGRPADLFTVRFAVHNRRYNSVAQFSSDVCFILDTVPDEEAVRLEQQMREASNKRWKRKRNNIGARGAFIKEMHNVFPWFDVDTGRVRDSSDVPEDLLPHATLPPHNDHNYAQWQDRDIDMLLGGPDTPMKNLFSNESPEIDNIGTIIWNPSPQKQFEDMRQCLFCGKYGDDYPTNAGRLLYCGQDEWVHVNCALWSAEVFERHDGSLQNVYSAVSRGKMMKCELCKLPGATVGCNTRDCPQNFHFSCAKLAQCTFQEDKKVFCARHVRNVDGELVLEERFDVARRVVVDNDEMRPNKRWQRGMMSQDITILLGSAIIHQLGHLSPSSDCKDYLVPVHFRMTRMFWSTVHAGHRVRYTITVTEQKSSCDGPAMIGGFGSPSSAKVESHENRTISHTQDDVARLPTTKSSKTLRHPAVDSCRSKLIDRMQSTHGSLNRRRSHEHEKSSVEPGVYRSRRFSGSSYTVINSFNGTLPQTITPLPAITKSSNHQRLLPKVTESTSDDSNSDPRTIANSKNETVGNDTTLSTNIGSEIGNAVLISPQNPFLNIATAGNDLPNQEVSRATFSNTVTTSSVVIESSVTKFIENSDPPSNFSSIDSTIIENNVVREVEMKELSTVRDTVNMEGYLTSRISANATANSCEATTFGSTCSESSLIDNPLQVRPLSPVLKSVMNASPASAKKHSMIKSSKVPTLSCLASNIANSNIVKKYLLGSSGSVMCTSMKGRDETDGKILDKDYSDVNKSNSRITVQTYSSVDEKKTELLPDDKKAHEMTSEVSKQQEKGALSLKTVPCKKSQITGLVSDAVTTETVVKSTSVSVSEKSISDSTIPSTQTQNSLIECVKPSKSKITFSDSVTQSVYSVAPELRVSVKRLDTPTVLDIPTTVSLLQEAKNAQDKEVIKSTSSCLNQSVDSTSLWWKKTAPVKKSMKKVKKPNPSKNDSNYCPDIDNKKNRIFRRKFQTDDEEEEVMTRVQTRSRSVGDIKINKSNESSLNESQSDDLTNGDILDPSNVFEATEIVLKNKVDEEPSENTPEKDKNDGIDAHENSEETIFYKKTELNSEKNDIGISLLHENKDANTSSNSSKQDSSHPDNLNKSSISDSSFSSGSPREASTRLRSLRKFAKNTEGVENQPVQTTKKKSPTQIERRKTRSFSHDSSLFVENTNIICNGVDHKNEPDISKELTKKADRARSKSADNSKKKKQVSDKNKSILDTSDFTPSRYPRRNPFTCLKSFSGLSPNYAIQLYSRKNSERQDRADARSLKIQTKQDKSKKDRNTTSKNKKRTSIESNPEDHIIDDIAELTPIIRSRRRNLSKDRKTLDSEKCNSSPSADVVKNVSFDSSFEKDESMESTTVDNRKSTTVYKVKENVHNDTSTSNIASSDNKESAECSKFISDDTNTTDVDKIETIQSAEKPSSVESSTIMDEDSSADKSSTINSKECEQLSGSQDTTCDGVNKMETRASDDQSGCDVIPTEMNPNDSEKLSDRQTTNCDEVNPTAKQTNNLIEPSVSLITSDDKVDQTSQNDSKKHVDADFKSSEENTPKNKQKILESKKQVDEDFPTTSEENQQRTIESQSTKLISKNVHEDILKPGTSTINADNDNLTNFDTELSQPANITVNDSNLRISSIGKQEPASTSTTPVVAFIAELQKSISSNIEGSGEATKMINTECTTEFDSVQDEVRQQAGDDLMETNDTSISTIDDSIEIVRGLIENGNADASNVVLPQPDVIQNINEPTIKQTYANTSVINSPVLPNTLPMLKRPSIPQSNQLSYNNNTNIVEDMESPLSPRDEPRLPLPMETDAAASFLVTSECPVLNADEVQSLLEMPPSTTVTCPTALQTVSTLIQTIPTPAVINTLSPQQQTFLQAQQYIQVSSRPTTPFPYVQDNVALVPVNFTPTQQLLVYNQPCSPTFIQQPVNIQAMPVQYGQSVIVSPKSNQGQFSFDMRYCSPVMPVVMPHVAQQATFITSPVLGSNLNLAVQPNQTAAQFSYANNISPTRINVRRAPGTGKIVPHQQTIKNNVISKEKPALRAKAPVVTKPNMLSPPSTVTQEPCLTSDVKLDAEQRKVLERMIEFYSNKNKLSDQEKQIVRAIIAQQIQNKNLPMPTLDTQEKSTPEIQTDHKQDQQSQQNIFQESNKPAVLHGTKRKKSPTDSHEPTQKRSRKMKRKEKLVARQLEPDIEEAELKCIQNDATFHGIQSSPLLDVYMNVVNAERISDDKTAKKLRDVIQTLSRRKIHLHVPWSSRKNQKGRENRLPPPPQSSKRSHLIYEIKSDDGYQARGSDLKELIANLLDSVQECRANACVRSPSSCLTSIISPHAFLGVSHDAVRFLVEQLPGARHCLKYRAKYYKHREPPAEVITHINPHGCARAEKYQGRSKPDMFSFLASKHRLPPCYEPSRTQNIDMQQNSTRRPTSMDLPMAMRFRHLRTSAREAVGVYRSAIHGRGLYCKRDIEAGEMVMEYTGEVIRCFLTDHREKMYETKGIGCYMFRMDDMYVVDATMMGSGARFINHSCEPSCYSRIVHIDGKKHIIIFALRKILRGEELTYDYKFPIEADDQKIMCNCGAKTCRKYMN